MLYAVKKHGQIAIVSARTPQQAQMYLAEIPAVSQATDDEIAWARDMGAGLMHATNETIEGDVKKFREA